MCPAYLNMIKYTCKDIHTVPILEFTQIDNLLTDSPLSFSPQSLLKEPRRREPKVRKERQSKNGSGGEEDEDKEICDSPRSDENSNPDDDDEVVRRPKKSKRPVAVEEPSSESDLDLEDLDVEDVDRVMRRLPENATSLLDFANASQGILLLLVLKQHLKNLYSFSDRCI